MNLIAAGTLSKDAFLMACIREMKRVIISEYIFFLKPAIWPTKMNQSA